MVVVRLRSLILRKFCNLIYCAFRPEFRAQRLTLYFDLSPSLCPPPPLSLFLITNFRLTMSVSVDDDSKLIHDTSLSIIYDAGSLYQLRPGAGSSGLLKVSDVGVLDELKGIVTELVILKGHEHALI